MNFFDAIKHCYKEYAVFSGRAPRSEFWWFFLFRILLYIGLSIVDPLGRLTGLAVLINLLPDIGVAVRRLHDVNRSGWWMLICLIPFVGAIVLIVWYATEGTRGANDFGDDPLRLADTDPLRTAVLRSRRDAADSIIDVEPLDGPKI